MLAASAYFPLMKKSLNVSGKTALMIMPVFGERSDFPRLSETLIAQRACACTQCWHCLNSKISFAATFFFFSEEKMVECTRRGRV